MSDSVNKPAHYQFGQMEAWDIIELAIVGTADPVTAYHQASAIKYLLRASRKNGAQDIAKAAQHLKREIARHAVCIPPSPDHDPANVAFRREGLDGACGIGAKLQAKSLGYAKFLDDTSYVFPVSAQEIADADGVSEYGNPTAPWKLP